MTARRRRVAQAERTSDVTRFRGVFAAAAVAAVVVAAAAWFGSPDGGASGPIAQPHAANAVACAACHDAPSFTAACTTCHGPHPSTRRAHRELALGCVDCHPGHGGGGARLATDGTATRYGTGGALPAGTTAFRPSTAMFVPVVTAATCARCHDLTAPRDPASACVIAGQDALGATRPTVCFDEHRTIRDAAGAIAPRAAAWDAAREVAIAAPVAPPAPPAPSPWWWLGLGVLAAGLVWTGARVVDRKRNTPTPPVEAEPPVARRAVLPRIDTRTCLGCYACVDACPYDVLEIHRYVAVVARPADCCGLILCEQKCPNGSLAIALVDDAAPPAIELAPTLESRVPGVFVAGDIGGTPLIRNAINQGARAIRAIAERPRAPAGLDVVIVGAGPAGLAASLEAQARGLRYVALEQATIADSIRSFPRGKLVIDPDLANESALWLAEASKEELLARWTRTVRELRPAIHEGRRVTGIARADTGFVVTDLDRDGAASAHVAAHVVLAIGRRGSPRRLAIAIPPAWADHVHYSLADARSFAHRRVLVVGLGDVAMEAAVALSRQPGTEVVIAARGEDFRRGKARNIAEVRRRVASGTLRVVWQSEVTALASPLAGSIAGSALGRSSGGRAATLATPTNRVEVACDSIFVLIGSLPGDDLLRSLGLVS